MLRISSSAEYAARIMVRLAMRRDAEPVSAERLSSGENIPRDFVDQLLMRLRRAGLVKSRRGVRGGYRLSRPAKDITLESILRAVDEGVFLPVCGRYAGRGTRCRRKPDCGIRPVWGRLGRLVDEFFGRITLDLLCEPEGRAEARVAGLFSARPRGRSRRGPR